MVTWNQGAAFHHQKYCSLYPPAMLTIHNMLYSQFRHVKERGMTYLITKRQIFCNKFTKPFCNSLIIQNSQGKLITQQKNQYISLWNRQKVSALLMQHSSFLVPGIVRAKAWRLLMLFLPIKAVSVWCDFNHIWQILLKTATDQKISKQNTD